MPGYDQLRNQADKVAELLRNAAQPAQADLGAQMAAPYEAQAAGYRMLAGGNTTPYEAYSGIIDKSKQAQQKDMANQVAAENDILGMLTDLRKQGNQDAEYIYSQAAKITGGDPTRMQSLFDELEKDPEEIDPNNFLLKALPAAKRANAIDPSFAIKDQTDKANLDLKKAQADYYERRPTAGGGGAGTAFERIAAKVANGTASEQEKQWLATQARGGKDPYANKSGELAAKSIAAGNEEAAAAETQLAEITKLESALKQAGPTGPVVGNIPGNVSAAGLYGGNTAMRQTVQALGPQVQLNFTNLTKGAISDREMGLFAGAVPGLDKDEGANAAIIAGMRAGFMRKIERANFMQAWGNRNSGNMEGAQQAWQKYINENPIIGDDFLVNEANIGNWQNYLGGGGASGAMPDPIQNAGRIIRNKKGERFQSDGEKWNPL